jgi:hypothetical protein
MPQEIETIERQLPSLRRFGALLIGSKKAADDRIELILSNLPSTALSRLADDRTVLFEIFHGTCSSQAAPIIQPSGFSENDRRLVAALHKLSLATRGLLLLATTEGFSHERMATILGLPAHEMPVRIMKARSQLAAALQNRLCVIVEDDMIALRDLQAEVTSKGFCVVGTAKNQGEAYGLADQMRPDIGFIDLALPEGATAGADSAERLRERFASKIIFVTAFSKLAKEIAGPGDMIVSKPWSPTSLNKAMSAVTA